MQRANSRGNPAATATSCSSATTTTCISSISSTSGTPIIAAVPQHLISSIPAPSPIPEPFTPNTETVSVSVFAKLKLAGKVTARNTTLVLLGLAIVLFQLQNVSHQHQHVLSETAAFAATPISSNQDNENRNNDNVLQWDFYPQRKALLVVAEGTGTETETETSTLVYTWQQSTATATATATTSKKRPLNFVHLPKNGGSTIIEAAIRAGLNWGDCLFQASWPGRECPPMPEGGNIRQEWPDQDPQGWGRVWWHTPIHQLPQILPNATSSSSNTYSNPYQGYDLFAILRNPYTRAISEFYYHCDRFPNLCKGIDGPRAARVLNRNIQKALKSVHMASHKSPEYYYHEGHWIPQADFVFDRKGKRLIEHLVHLETIQEELPSLLQAYNLTHMTLPPQPVKSRPGYPLMDHRNLTLATIKFIEIVYERDFQLGGYHMLSPIISMMMG